MFSNKHSENLLDEDLDDDDLSYATDVGADEIPGVDSDLSEVSDVPDKELFSPVVEVQQSPNETEDNDEMETIQEEDKGEVSVDEKMKESEILEESEPSPQKTASRVCNLESAGFSLLPNQHLNR